MAEMLADLSNDIGVIVRQHFAVRENMHKQAIVFNVVWICAVTLNDHRKSAKNESASIPARAP